MKVILKMVRLHKFLFWVTALFTLTHAVLCLLLSNFWAEVLDSLFINPTPGMYVKQGIVIILFAVLNEFLASYMAAYTCEIFAHELRVGYAQGLLEKDIQTLSEMNVGAIQSVVQNELKDISLYLNENLFPFIRQFVLFFTTMVYLFCMEYRLAWVTLAPVILLMVYCYFSGRVIKNYAHKTLALRQKINGLTGTLLDLFPIIKVYDAYKLMKENMEQGINRWQHSYVKKERRSALLMSISGAFSFFPVLLLLGVGGGMVIKGEITIGVFYVFINLSGNVSGFLQNMPNIYARFRQFEASAERLDKNIKPIKVARDKYGRICN